MKLSDLLLQGFKQVNGQQCQSAYWSGGSPEKPESVCLAGAINLALNKNAELYKEDFRQDCAIKSKEIFGVNLITLNDGHTIDQLGEMFRFEDVIGILQSEGL